MFRCLKTQYQNLLHWNFSLHICVLNNQPALYFCFCNTEFAFCFNDPTTKFGVDSVTRQSNWPLIQISSIWVFCLKGKSFFAFLWFLMTVCWWKTSCKNSGMELKVSHIIDVVTFSWMGRFRTPHGILYKRQINKFFGRPINDDDVLLLLFSLIIYIAGSIS